MASQEKIDKATLLEGLNVDLAHEYQAILMYNTYAAVVSGINRGELRDFFLKEVQDEFGHAQYLANKITALGGTPTTKPAAVKMVRESREMLEQVVASEAETVVRYVERMKQAQAFGDYGLANTLEDMLSDETRHKEEASMLLHGDWC